MGNKYVNFISDEHLLNCIANLNKAYLKAKNNLTKKNFYSNKVDTIKLIFDAEFNNIDQESLIQADNYKKAKCYWVQILAKGSFNENWIAEINGKEYSHSRVYKISGDQFYALLSGQEDALMQLYKALPIAIKDYLNLINKNEIITKNSALDEIKIEIQKSERSILDQITSENYSYYLGFDKL